MEKEISGFGNVIEISSDISAKIRIIGSNNKLFVGSNTIINGQITIIGNNNTFNIGNWCVLLNCFLGVTKANYCILNIGDNTTSNGRGSFQFHETGSIIIGKDCMFSSEIITTVSDMHPIYDIESGSRVNNAKPILLGDHVWVGLRSLVAKGSNIGSGSVIGAHSVVTGSIPKNCIAAGVPARIVQTGINWDRDFPSIDCIN